MAASPAQGQEDVAAPARPAVGRRPLDDLPADPRRPDAVPRHRHQAGPRLRELRDDADTPQYLGLVAAGPTNPTARVEYALRADELLTEPQVRQIMEYYLAVRMRRYGRAFQPTEVNVRVPIGPPDRRRSRRTAASASPVGVGPRCGRTVSTVRSDPRTAGRPTGALLSIHLGHDPVALHDPGLGDSERRRLGRRRSRFLV